MKIEQQKIAVLMGGNSAEREISLKSGRAVYESLLKQDLNVELIDVGDDIFEKLRQSQITLAFIIMHGRGGEDGTIQGLLEWANIPYTGSSVLASALAMDKIKTKQVWQSLGIPTPKFNQLNEDSDFSKVISDLGGKVFVKPAREGSSIGMNIAKTESSLKESFYNAFKYDSFVLAEQLIEGEEYTVGIVDDKALPIIKVETKEDFYDFDAKYQVDTTKYIFPCGLNDDKCKELQKLAVRSYKSINCSGWGRVDMILDKNLNPFVLEVNTVPGMTSNSLLPKAAKFDGISFDSLVLKVLESSC